MKVILDTHVLIWADTDKSKLSQVALDYFADPACDIFLSVVCVWEMAIKSDTGKLTLRAPLDQIVAESVAANSLRLLPVTLDHVLRVRGLPSHHKDPFDRMLVAQALAEGAVVLTADPLVRQYPVATAW